jgi:hypothetical protein
MEVAGEDVRQKVIGAHNHGPELQHPELAATAPGAHLRVEDRARGIGDDRGSDRDEDRSGDQQRSQGHPDVDGPLGAEHGPRLHVIARQICGRRGGLGLLIAH